ncbi:ImmA/IrrE family metallo-endopeptidase [Actinopolyspora mortivallis]|nr:ImmA/IrrE family metallo-endopeptidase [Actinopolyspora mortivallis]
MLSGENTHRRWAQRRRERRLRRDLRATLRAAGIDHPMDMTEVCHRLSRRRSRPIHATEYPLAANGPFGLWIPGRKSEWILFQSQTTPLHQQHIIAHELGHILCGHRPDPILPGDGVDPTSFDWGTLRRTAYDTDQEHEAEITATLLLETARTWTEISLPTGSARARRAQRTLSHQARWL